PLLALHPFPTRRSSDLSALEDLTTSTLQALSGMWARLQYLAGLQSARGEYRHWGLARTYGSQATQEACQEAHRGVLSNILRTPLDRKSTRLNSSHVAIS